MALVDLGFSLNVSFYIPLTNIEQFIAQEKTYGEMKKYLYGTPEKSPRRRRLKKFKNNHLLRLGLITA